MVKGTKNVILDSLDVIRELVSDVERSVIASYEKKDTQAQDGKDLWRLMQDDHNLLLVESEIQDIRQAVINDLGIEQVKG